jgi:hypothetical protein
MLHTCLLLANVALCLREHYQTTYLLLTSSRALCSTLTIADMADYAFGGSDDETAELKKLNAEVVHRCAVMYAPNIATDFTPARRWR